MRSAENDPPADGGAPRPPGRWGSLLDPVTRKEIFGISRRGQTYWGRVVYVGLTGLIVWQFWWNLVSTTPFFNVSASAELGRELFHRFLPMQMILVSLAAIGASADRVIREERAGTLGLLLLTPLSARAIAWAKWKAAVAQSASLVLCGTPVLAVCVYLGGLSAGELLWGFGLTLAMAFLGAAFGLRASAVAPTVPRALLLGLGYLVLHALAPLALLFVGGPAGVITAPFVHPIYSLYWLLYEPGRAGLPLDFSWIASSAVSMAGAWYLVGSTAALIEMRVRSPRAAAPSPDPGPIVLPGPRRGRRESPAAPLRPWRELWDAHPLFWKEIMTRSGSRWSREVKSMFMVYALIFIALCWLFSRGTHVPTFAVLGAGFTALAVVNGASLFAPEKEGRKMDMLLSAPVSSSDLVWSKLASGVLSPEALKMELVALGTAVAFSWWSGPGVFVFIGVLFIHLSFAFALAAAASLSCATLQGAALVSTGVLSGIFFVLPLLGRALTAGAVEPGASKVALALSVLDPLWVLEALGPDGPAGAALPRLGLFGAVYAGIIAGLVGMIHVRFDRKMGRI